jgi:hypothetical protein
MTAAHVEWNDDDGTVDIIVTIDSVDYVVARFPGCEPTPPPAEDA